MLIKDLAKEWPAYNNWKNDSYLIKQAGDDMITAEGVDRQFNEFAYFQKKYGRKEMTYGEFMEIMEDETRDRNYYFAEQAVPVNLEQDIIIPEMADKYLPTESVYYWDGIGTKSLGHTDDAENIMCVLRGWKDFYIVSPFESLFVYPGQKEDYPSNYSPVNFDNPDFDKWPQF